VSVAAGLAGGADPTGSITFRLYGPDDATCSHTPVSTSARLVAGNGNYFSADFTPTAAGTYRWVVSYSGDDDNEAVRSACGAANVVASAPPAVTPPVVVPVVVPAKPVAPAGLSVRIKPRRDRSLPYVYRISGVLSLPASVTMAKGCLGKVTVQIKNGRKTISTRTVSLRSDCSYASRVRFTQKYRLRTRGGRLKVLVKFLGNPALTARRARSTTVRYG
jgi:hypothetical protein